MFNTVVEDLKQNFEVKKWKSVIGLFKEILRVNKFTLGSKADGYKTLLLKGKKLVSCSLIDFIYLLTRRSHPLEKPEKYLEFMPFIKLLLKKKVPKSLIKNQKALELGEAKKLPKPSTLGRYGRKRTWQETQSFSRGGPPQNDQDLKRVLLSMRDRTAETFLKSLIDEESKNADDLDDEERRTSEVAKKVTARMHEVGASMALKFGPVLKAMLEHMETLNSQSELAVISVPSSGIKTKSDIFKRMFFACSRRLKPAFACPRRAPWGTSPATTTLSCPCSSLQLARGAAATACWLCLSAAPRAWASPCASSRS